MYPHFTSIVEVVKRAKVSKICKIVGEMNKANVSKEKAHTFMMSEHNKLSK